MSPCPKNIDRTSFSINLISNNVLLIVLANKIDRSLLIKLYRMQRGY